MPVLSADEFLGDHRFRHFKAKFGDEVQTAIDAAHSMWSEPNCGPLYKQIVTYQTAVLLSTGFGGAPASKTRTSSDTPYDKVLEQLTRGIVGSGLVLGCR